MSTKLSVTVGLLMGGSIIVAKRLLPQSLAVRGFEIGEEISSVDNDSSRKSGVCVHAWNCGSTRQSLGCLVPFLPLPPIPLFNFTS